MKNWNDEDIEQYLTWNVWMTEIYDKGNRHCQIPFFCSWLFTKKYIIRMKFIHTQEAMCNYLTKIKTLWWCYLLEFFLNELG